MLLRASGESSGVSVELRLILDSDAKPQGIEHAPALLAFAEALVRADEPALSAARSAVLEGLGPRAVVDAAAITANFQRMVRIADSTGIALDAFMLDSAGSLPRDLGLDRFASARNTPDV